MEIKNVTKYSKEINEAFQKVHFRRTLVPLLIIISAFALVAAGILCALDDWAAGLGLLVFIALYNLLIIFIYKWSIKRNNKSYILLQEEPVNIYTFTENEIKIESKSKNTSGDASYTYNLIHMVVISKNIIALYMNKINAYLVDKNGYTSGTHEDLIELLKQKVDKKKIKNIK